MHETERSVLLWLLAISFVVVGAWALFLPASFHADFPLDRAWVALDGPYNEHLVRDVGGLQLALAVVTGTAVRWSRYTAVAAVAVLLFAIPHLAYHAWHLEPFGPTDAIAQLVALAVQVLVPVRLLMIVRGRGPGAA